MTEIALTDPCIIVWGASIVWLSLLFGIDFKLVSHYFCCFSEGYAGFIKTKILSMRIHSWIIIFQYQSKCTDGMEEAKPIPLLLLISMAGVN